MAASFRGGSEASEPGIHNHDRWLWIPGPRQRARPGMTVDRVSSKPPLPAFEAFQVFKTLALVAGAAEVEFLDVLVVAQFVGAAVEHRLASFHDVAVAGHRQCGARVLLDQ